MRTFLYPPTPVSVTVPPVAFYRDGVSTNVSNDTATPSNNRPLPSGIYILKDGIAYPVGVDSVTPSNTVAIPVEIRQVDGTTINITAGDINVQTSHVGANYDSTRIGDGTNLLVVNADGSINVADMSNVLAKLTSIDGKDFSTSAKQDLAKAVLDSIKTAIDTTNAKDFSTSAKQDLAKAVLDNILTAIGTTNSKDFATSAKQDAQAALTGAVTEAAPASDTASSGLNGRLQRIAQRITSLIALLPTSLGQKAMAASLAVTIASDQSALTITEPTRTGSYQEDLTVTDGAVETFTAPAGAKWCKIQADSGNNGNARVKIGGAATTTSGHQLEPGRSEDFAVAGNISYTMEAGGSGKLYVTFGA